MSVNFMSPCYGCTDRSAECHSTCERYKVYTAKVEEVRAERAVWNKVRDARGTAYEYSYNKCHNKRKQSHWQVK